MLVSSEEDEEKDDDDDKDYESEAEEHESEIDPKKLVLSSLQPVVVIERN